MSQLPPDPPVAGTPPPPPPEPPAPPGGGASGVPKAVVAVVVLFLLVIVAGGAFLVLSGDDGDGDDPAQAVRDYFDAALDRSCERLIGLVSEASWSEGGTVTREDALAQCAIEVRGEDFIPAGLRVDAVEVTSQSDDAAEVDVTSTSDAEGEQTESVILARENGRWVVDFAAEESQEAGG